MNCRSRTTHEASLVIEPADRSILFHNRTPRRDEISFQIALRLTDNKLTGPRAKRGEGGTGGDRQGQTGTGGDRQGQVETGRDRRSLSRAIGRLAALCNTP